MSKFDATLRLSPKDLAAWSYLTMEESVPIHNCEEPLGRRGCSNGTNDPKATKVPFITGTLS